MRLWIGMQLWIVLVFFALATIIWTPSVIVVLSLFTFPLVMLVRVQHAISASGLSEPRDFRVVALFLAWCGLCNVVFPFVLQELYWLIKDSLFGTGRNDSLWSWIFEQSTFVAIGVALTCCGVIVWVVLRNRDATVEEIRSSYFSSLLRGFLSVVAKPIKFLSVAVFTPLLTLALAFSFGTLLFVFGGFSASEIYEEPSINLQYTMLVGGFLLTIIAIFFLTVLWWPRESLASAIEVNDGA